MLAEQIRIALRALIRAPGFSVAAVLTLALGIGLSTAVFTVADALLLRALPVHEQDRVVALWTETPDGRFSNYPLPLDHVREFEQRTTALEQVAYFGFRGATPTPARVEDRVLPLRSALVSGNFFEVLGSRAVLGRPLRPQDDVRGAAPVVVLSHRAWQRYFGGDSAIIGRPVAMLRFSGSYPIVGVMPRGLEYPRGTDMWIPLTAHGAAGGFLEIVSGELDLLGRLRSGATPASARNELTTYLTRSGAPAWQRELRGVVNTLPDLILGDTRPAVLVVMLAAGLLLCISCVNVANLAFVRSLGRAREIVVRSALGASRGRIATYLLTESAILALVGGLLGVALAIVAVGVFAALAPATLPRVDEIGVSAGALGAALVITATAMLMSGLGPAFLTSRVSAHDVLRTGSRLSGGRRVRGVAELLVVAQVALAAVSLSTAGLVARSLINLLRVDLSFQPSQVLVAELVMRQGELGDTKARAVMDLVMPRVEALPGVRAVTPVLTAPFAGAGGGIDGRLSKPGQSRDEMAANPIVNLEIVATDYFATLGIPMSEGRPFSDEDQEGAAPVVIVSRSAARHLWPGDDAIGKRVNVPGGEATVVGVVPDTRYRELHAARPSAYFPLRQSRFPVEPTTLLIRTTNAPENLIAALRDVVSRAHPGVTLASVAPLERFLDAPRAEPRMNALVLALFAGAAVSLAGIGLFAVVAASMRQRTRELGIRMALGATAGQVHSMVMIRGLGLAVAGTSAGIAGTLAVGRLLSGLLFEVRATDIPTMASVTVLMLGVAAVATLLPARVSSRIDPVIALRSDD